MSGAAASSDRYLAHSQFPDPGTQCHDTRSGVMTAGRPGYGLMATAKMWMTLLAGRVMLATVLPAVSGMVL